MKHSMNMRRQVQCYMYEEEWVVSPGPVRIHATLLWHSERDTKSSQIGRLVLKDAVEIAGI
jgi:hypothetical protein